VSVALVASGTTAVTDAAVTLQDGGETEMDLTIMLRPTAVPGSAYDLVVTTGSTGPTFTVTKPRFVVVDAAYQPPILEFPTGTDSLRQGDLLQNQPWLCPNQYYTYASLCGLLLVRLPASGNLTTRLAWHASSDPDDGFYGRLRVDPPGHVTQSFTSPITMVTHGSAGDLMRITVDGFVVAGFIDFLFAPDP
jgi:hypothetical protein